MDNQLEYQEGKQAYLDGENLSTNPYTKEDDSIDRYVAWYDGWYAAYEAEE